MLIVMTPDATETDVARRRFIESLGFKAHPMPGANRTAIGLTGNEQGDRSVSVRGVARRGRVRPA